MTGRVLSVEGSQDGIRFGMISLTPGSPKRYCFDRFTGRVSLWRMHNPLSEPEGRKIEVRQDKNPRRVAEAEEILRETIGVVG